ncbi:MAG TPA: FHA domain-containing protein [Thermoanaerobaculia bacterium]|nr:FHA domain-containing protein [Thermoanaerobaculia bacterium]
MPRRARGRAIGRSAGGAALLLAAAALGAIPAAAAPPALVVAIDTSRSLRPETLAQAAGLAAATLQGLPPDTTVGVLAFDDAPRWALESGSPAAAAERLRTLDPAGRFTLLDDALFTAARAVAPGGTVLLLTDGRDENSATTIEDVARACEARGVRVIAVGAGSRLDERTLRRLALLTGGSYLGSLGTVRPASVVAAAAAPPVPVAHPLAPAREPAAPAVERAPTAAALVPAVVPATARATAAAEATAAPRSSRRWWWLTLPLALVAIAVPVAVWARGNGRQRTTFCRRCGNEVPAGEDCPQCAAKEKERALQERLRSRDLTRLEDTGEFRIDVESLVTAKKLDPDAIEKTRVLADQSVLMVREPGESQRSYLLRGDGAFAVGRDPRSNTLTLRDPALSAHHFKVGPDDGMFFVIDLDSTNGTYVNRQRVRAVRLASGDVIQAGQVELEFRSFLAQVA